MKINVEKRKIYELLIYGKDDYVNGRKEFRMYNKVKEFKYMLFVEKYELMNEYNVDLIWERNGMKKNFGGNVKFNDDGNKIRFEKNLKNDEDILLYFKYKNGKNGRYENLKVVRNGNCKIMD
jgi:hypothetical protein